MSKFELVSGEYILALEEAEKGYALAILRDGRRIYKNAAPISLFSKKPTASIAEFSCTYSDAATEGDVLRAYGEITTAAGSVFLFIDEYCPSADGGFVFTRNVEVKKAEDADRGFSTRFALQPEKEMTLETVNCFAPGVWYQKNEYVPPHFMGYQKKLRYHWMYETQYALPMFAIQDEESGESVCLSRLRSDVKLRDVTRRLHALLVDETLTFGGIGLSTANGLSLDYMYPGAQGTSTRPLPSGFALEPEYKPQFHPVREGYCDTYSVKIDLLCEKDFSTMMKYFWRNTYSRLCDPIVELDNEVLYKNCMELLKKETEKFGESWGLPFSISLPDASPMNVAYQFGFVGQQPNIGYQLMRYGVMAGDEEALEKGRGIIDFWASTSLSDFGAPHIWYNPELEIYEDRPFWVRMIGDGMEGILDAYVFLRKHNEEHEPWLEYCRKVGNWLAKAQNEDGSWYRSYDGEGKMLMESKANTSNVIRFLVQLYIVTKDEAYRESALRAGHWSLENITRHLEYRGGTCDNSDIYDKESGIYAIFAYLALYDMSKDNIWLDAARAAADYTETWTYAWSFPIAVSYPNNPLRGRNMSGQSLIATGHSSADVYMAACPYIYYRLYLLTDDEHYLHFARFLHKNSKQCTDYDGSYGYKYAGLCHESGGFSDQTYGGMYHWLPWCTYVQVDPISRLYDSFGVYEIDDAQKLDKTELKKRNDIYSEYAKF